MLFASTVFSASATFDVPQPPQQYFLYRPVQKQKRVTKITEMRMRPAAPIAIEPVSHEPGSVNENPALLGTGVVVGTAAAVVDDVNDIDDILIPIFALLLSR
jgi:hypothetical protein